MIPINAIVTKTTKLGKQPVQLGVGARYWVQTPESGPEGWGVRAVVSFMFPKG